MKKELFGIKDMDVIFRKITADTEGNKHIEEYPHPEIKVSKLINNEICRYTLCLETYLESEVLNEINFFEEIELILYGEKHENEESVTKHKILHNMEMIEKETKLDDNYFYKTTYIYKAI